MVEGVGVEGGSPRPCAFIAALWIRLKGWLFGGLIVEGSPSMRRRSTFFSLCLRHCLVQTSCSVFPA